ncbi:MAG: hypothetical protein R3336_05400, partial [Phycisphaeraceae bacterium]|nr:hypothetical protein [Phycisphaeraceae bacterium]
MTARVRLLSLLAALTLLGTLSTGPLFAQGSDTSEPPAATETIAEEAPANATEKSEPAEPTETSPSEGENDAADSSKQDEKDLATTLNDGL